MILTTAAVEKIFPTCRCGVGVERVVRAGENVAQQSVLTAVAEQNLAAQISVERVGVIAAMQFITHQQRLDDPVTGRRKRKEGIPVATAP